MKAIFMQKNKDSFYKKAKIYNLDAKEADFIHEYAVKCGIDPMRVFANQDFFKEIVKRYQTDTLVADNSLIQSIQKKLGFDSRISLSYETTKDIEYGQKAKLYIDRSKWVPLALEKVADEYTMWRVLPHRDSTLLKSGMRGDMIFEQNSLVAYKFPVTIQEIRSNRNEILIKIPHSELELLAKRRYPRVECHFDGVIRKKGDPRQNAFYICQICNISEGGVKICMDAPHFQEKDNVILQFKINFENIQAESTIEAKIAYNGHGEYGLKFKDLDADSKHIIKQYIQANLSKEIH